MLPEPAGQNLVGRFHDRRGDRFREPSEITIGFGGRLLDENRGGNEIRRRAKAADREVVDRASAVILFLAWPR